jgi:multiple sugar transport system substrate-binding protein
MRDTANGAGRARGGVSRRRFLQGTAAAAGLAATGLGARPASAAVSGDISFATFEWSLPHTGSVLRAVTETFNKKYPDAKVVEVNLPNSGYHDQILTQLTAGTPPDLFRIDDPQLSLYMSRDLLLPLDDAFKAAGVDPSKFAAAGRVDATRDGKTYAVVYQTNVRQMIYNKALLADAGIAEAPKTFAEFETAIDKATNRSKGVFGYTMATKDGEASAMMSFLAPVIFGFGSYFTTPDGKPNATDPKVIQALEFVKRMWDRDNLPRGLDGVAANKLIFDGKVALSLNGPFVFGAAAPEVKPNLFSANSPLPGGQLVRASSWYGVPRKAKNPEAAIAWLMNLLTPESQAKVVEVELVVPAIPSLVPAKILADSPWFKTFVDGADTAVSFLPPGLGDKANAQIKVIGDEIQQILYRNKAIPDAMATLQKTLEANLKG